MKVCKPFGPTLSYEKSEYDAESNITKRVPYKQKTLMDGRTDRRVGQNSDLDEGHL